MIHTPTTTAVLQKNPHALQGLHDELGFDFEKPFFSYTHAGAFTANKIYKKLPVTDQERIVVLLIRATAEKCCHNKLYAVTMREKSFGVSGLRFGHRYNIDHFWGVCDFEETRKNKTETVFVFAQDVDYIHPIKQSKTINPRMRYTVAYAQKAVGSGQTYYSSLDLIPRDGSGEKVQYKPFFQIGEKRTRDMCDYIDKSGYLVTPHREELKRKARALKAEREKIAMQNADFSNDEKKIAEKLQQVKRALCDAILSASNRCDAVLISRAENRFSSALWMLDYYNKNKDSFASIAKKRGTIDDILEKLSLTISALNDD